MVNSIDLSVNRYFSIFFTINQLKFIKLIIFFIYLVINVVWKTSHAGQWSFSKERTLYFRASSIVISELETLLIKTIDMNNLFFPLLIRKKTLIHLLWSIIIILFFQATFIIDVWSIQRVKFICLLVVELVEQVIWSYHLLKDQKVGSLASEIIIVGVLKEKVFLKRLFERL